MTAPSLILLGYGSNDPRVAQVSHEIRAGILEIRADLDISIAFLDHCPPSGLQVVNQLVKRRIHRLFVVDEDGSLVGVITTLDLLSRLAP